MVPGWIPLDSAWLRVVSDVPFAVREAVSQIKNLAIKFENDSSERPDSPVTVIVVVVVIMMTIIIQLPASSPATVPAQRSGWRLFE